MYATQYFEQRQHTAVHHADRLTQIASSIVSIKVFRFALSARSTKKVSITSARIAERCRYQSAGEPGAALHSPPYDELRFGLRPTRELH